MAGTTSTALVRIGACGIVVAILVPFVRAEGPGGYGDRHHGRAVYQRRAFDWMDKHDREHRHSRFHVPEFHAPPVSSGWFQRPYPYHLDYYKMRYGGSYAPYFGNLYGPPQVVTAPPYYGPYYGGYEYGQPNAYGPNGVVHGPPVELIEPKDQPASVPENDGLPPP